MNAVIAGFLKYDYGFVVDIAKRLLLVYGGSFGVAFAILKIFLPDLRKVPHSVWWKIPAGVFCFGIALIFDIALLMGAYIHMWDFLYPMNEHFVPADFQKEIQHYHVMTTVFLMLSWLFFFAGGGLIIRAVLEQKRMEPEKER